MKKRQILNGLFMLLFAVVVFSSCANPKEFVINDEVVTVEPYGWMTRNDENENVNYEVCIQNIVVSVIFGETIIVPIIITGLQLWQPVSIKQEVVEVVAPAPVGYVVPIESIDPDGHLR